MGKSRGKARIFGAVAFAGLMGVGSYAFTASNSVEASNAGQGSQTISGYDVSGITYGLDTSTGTANVSSVSFNLANQGTGTAAPSNVKARLTGTGTYQSCVKNVVTSKWDCNFTGITALSTASLDVTAIQ